MYPTWSPNNPSPIYGDQDYKAGHSMDRSQMERPPKHSYSPTTTQPPRPMEPICRPPLHSMLTETAGKARLQEAPSFQELPYPESRTRCQNLPALREILPRDSYSPKTRSFSAPWLANAPPSASTQAERGNYSLEEVHPPMVLPPPTPTTQRYPPELSRPFDESNMVDGRRPQAISLSPYNGYSESSQWFTDVPLERPNETTSTFASSSVVTNIYNDPISEGPSPRTQTATQHRSMRSSHSQTGADSHGKYLRVEEVPGEGEFYIYEDGHRIPTQVDGEHVNPAWGLTKANKPRKRLATACLDCREKKIKCEPGGKSCIQCEKAMRPCRKASDKSVQPDTSTNTLYVAGSPVRKGPPATDPSRTSSRNPEPEVSNKRRAREHSSSPPLVPSKKLRDSTMQPNFLPGSNPVEHEDTTMRSPAEISDIDMSRKDPLSWEDDPYAVEPDMVLQLLELYFDRINNAIYCFFPRKHFFHWVKNYPSKCQREKMVLYAMLAAASILANHEFSSFGKQCAQIAGDAVASQTGKFTVAAAQTKLLLAYYHLAKGAEGYEWDYIGSAIRTVSNMNLNTEAGCLDDKASRGQSRYEFAFSPAQLAECKRRTFWCVFFQDRFCGPTTCAIKPEDIFVRMPCSDEMYENSDDSDAPYFANGIIDPLIAGPMSPNSVSPIVWLIPVVAAWGDVTDFVFRASHRADSTYRKEYEAFYSSIQMRLEEWSQNLPENLQYTIPNLGRSSQEGYLETFVLIHILYHYCMIKLNRYMRHSLLQDLVIRNIRSANHHGHTLLQIVNATQDAPGPSEIPAQGDPSFVFASPIIAFAITSAIDIVSAGGHDSKFASTLDEIDKALYSLRELQRHWNIAQNQRKACETRFYQLKNITTSPKTAKSGCWLGRNWGTVAPPLEQDVDLKNDCIYGLGKREGDEASQMYFDAFSEG